MAELEHTTLEHGMLDAEGRSAGTALLDGRIFDAEVQAASVHAAVRQQLCGRRAGTHATLNRTRMQGGGKKPYRQKGTGNARAGSNTSPLWYGGAVIHGPMPRSYEFKLPRKVRRQALISVLSARRKSGALFVLDQLQVDSGKTKDMLRILEKLGVAGKRVALLIPEEGSSEGASKLWRAARNLEQVAPFSVKGANVYDLTHAEVLVCTQATALALQSRLNGDAAPQG